MKDHIKIGIKLNIIRAYYIEFPTQTCRCYLGIAIFRECPSADVFFSDCLHDLQRPGPPAGGPAPLSWEPGSPA